MQRLNYRTFVFSISSGDLRNATHLYSKTVKAMKQMTYVSNFIDIVLEYRREN